MYACTYEIGAGFFEGVCTPSNATANFRVPPPPPHALYWNQVRTAKRPNHPWKPVA
jgi:hypothetical protein